MFSKIMTDISNLFNFISKNIAILIGIFFYMQRKYLLESNKSKMRWNKRKIFSSTKLAINFMLTRVKVTYWVSHQGLFEPILWCPSIEMNFLKILSILS